MSDQEHFSSVEFESEANTPLSLEGLDTDRESHVASFQLRRKYIITTIKSGMLIIHQNRAHQRILYEKFLKNVTLKESVSQQLLFPLVLSFSKAELAIISDIQGQLQLFGFVFDEIAEEQVKISGIPYLIPENEVGIVLDSLIAETQTHGELLASSPLDMLSQTLSKTLAVKTGTPLNQASQQSLVNDLFACREPKLCPYNKATYTTITEAEIDKNFN